MNEKYKQYFTVQLQCPVCESSNVQVKFDSIIHTCNVLKKAEVDVSNEEVPTQIYFCVNCKHSYLSHVVKDEILSNYYSVVNSEYYDRNKTNISDHRESDNKKFAELIKEKCENSTTVLEIGSGMGFLLNQLQKLGLNCYGVEPSNFASQFSRDSFNLNVVTALLNETTFSSKKFDIIILSDVVEHVANINAMFTLVQHYLSKNGKVVVLTGNSNSLYARCTGKKWLYYFSWEHVSFFNKTSIKALFEKHALCLDYFKTTQHTGSFLENCRIVLYTMFSMIRNLFGIRKETFYYMAFDHFIAIGKNINND